MKTNDVISEETKLQKLKPKHSNLPLEENLYFQIEI